MSIAELRAVNLDLISALMRDTKIMPTSKRPTDKELQREIDSLDLLPPAQAASRTDDLLRNMLRSPPEPHAPKTNIKVKRK
jgi:hypothetical protein